MNKKLTLGICILIFLVLPMAYANVLVPYESATVSRIVGDDPAEMMQQLQQEPEAQINRYILGDHVPDDVAIKITNLISESEGYTGKKGLWSWFEEDIQNLNKKNPLILLHSFGNIKNNEVRAYNVQLGVSSLEPDETKDWLTKFQIYNPIILFDSDYAGLYLPNLESFVGMLGQDSIFIAPSAVADKSFDLAILCNLEKYDEIGELFRQARNNYYLGLGSPSGLALMSYQLLGNPFFKYSASGLNSNYISEYCDSLSKEYEVQSYEANGFGITSYDDYYEKRFEFIINNYQIAKQGDYFVIKTDETINSMNLFELVLPKRVLAEEFPLNTIITELEGELEDPISITIPQLPMQGINGLMNRTCYEETKEASVDFSHTYTEDSLIVLTTINPVEVVNCTTGELKLYTKIKYKIEYVPYSPVLIKEIEAPNYLLPGQKVNITATLKNVWDEIEDGYLVIKDENENIKISKPITSDGDNYEIELTAPEEEGFYTYRIDFYHQNESKTYKEFDFEVKILDIDLIIPEVVINNADIEVIITNNFNSNLNVDLDYYLSHNSETEDSGSQSLTLAPGKNSLTISFNNLEKEKAIYDVLVGVAYLNSYKVATGTIITNHAPVIIQSNIKIKENESFSLNPMVYDLDGDYLTTDIDYPFDYDENWVASFEDEGMYDITITADDGYKQIEKIISLTIENTNRAPTIEQIDNIEAAEGETITIEPTYADPDNENGVDNDDNELSVTYSVDNPWNLSYESSGTHLVYAMVSDGEYTDTVYFNITIENTNRDPVINVTKITVMEGYLINLSEYVYDPDNRNSVDNDDNELSIIVDKFTNGTWQTGYDDSGAYSLKVELTDQESIVSKKIIITIINKNQPPIIETVTNIIAYEGELLNIVTEIYDLDNENEDPNDDNENLKITYPSPLDENGNWQTTDGDSGIYVLTLTGFDGLDYSYKNITIHLYNKNRPPEIRNISDLNVKEGETITLDSLVLFDLDNENNATNDDNELIITYDKFFNSESTATFNYEQSGNYTVSATVSDGKLEYTTTFDITIENTNRAPDLSLIEDKITIYETEGLAIDTDNIDPDNTNNVTNDDNELVVKFGGVLDENGEFSTKFGDAGLYNVSISVNDGEFNVSKNFTIEVLDSNRPPEIISYSPKTTGYIGSHDNLTLTIEAEDFENENLTIKWYIAEEELGEDKEFVFNANGTEAEFEIKAIVYDSETNVSHVFRVITIPQIQETPVEPIEDIAPIDEAPVENIIPEPVEIPIEEEIKKLELKAYVYINGEKEIIKENKKIEINPGDELEFKISIKNKLNKKLYSELEVDISGIDEASKSFDIKGNKDKAITIDLDVPKDSREGIYFGRIEWESEDEAGTWYEKEISFDVEVIHIPEPVVVEAPVVEEIPVIEEPIVENITIEEPEVSETESSTTLKTVQKKGFLDNLFGLFGL